jgi:hypothetical protein
MSLLFILGAGMLVGVTVTLAQTGSKTWLNPDVGRSDADRAMTIAQLKDRNAKWVEDFVSSGRDPRQLPVVQLETWSTGASSVADARSQSTVVVSGTVLSTTYTADPNNLTESVATVRMNGIGRGALPETIQVDQVGGPAWSPTGGELQELQGDPLLLPAQDVVLLLVPASSSSDSYRTVYGAGVYWITGSGLRAPESNPFASEVNGLSVEAAFALFD